MRTQMCIPLLLVLSLSFIGCGGSSVELKPNYNHPRFSTAERQSDSVEIVRVIDNRSSPTMAIGIAQVGAFNKKVPYLLLDSLSVFVKRVLDSVFVSNPQQAQFLPVTVFVDSFLVGESTSLFSEVGWFVCKMRFVFPVAADSVGQVIVTSTKEATGMDVTNLLEGLIYDGVAECAGQFTREVLHARIGFALSRATPPSSMTRMDSLVASNESKLQSKPEEGFVVDSAKRYNDIALFYLKGGKVATGIRGGYDRLKQIGDGMWYAGGGLSVTFMDIQNKEDNLVGTFFNFGGRVLIRCQFSESTIRPYLGGGLAIVFGGERVQYPGREETSFFVGPMAEEVVGISFGKNFAIEGGAYQLRYFSSLLLPSDTGFLLGVRIGI